MDFNELQSALTEIPALRFKKRKEEKRAAAAVVRAAICGRRGCRAKGSNSAWWLRNCRAQNDLQ